MNKHYRFHFAYLIVLTASLLNISAIVWSDDNSISFDEIRSYIREQIIDQDVPSIAVAVAKDGKIIWEEGFGWADRENRIPATEHTMYSLASISKPITATGLMVLVEQGKIDLDKPINDYLGDSKLRAWIGDAKDATVRRVAQHIAGLPLHFQFFFEDEPSRRPSMDETIVRFGNIVFPPDERYQYSNLGYGILEYAMERVSGEDYARFMRESVFIPLGLTHTAVFITSPRNWPVAVRYGSNQNPLPFYDFDHRAASAVYSSAHDLVCFAMFHLKNHLTDQKAILPDRILDAIRDTTDVKWNYAIGWGIEKRELGHSGGMPGVATTLRLFPSENLAIAVLANTSTGLPHRIADRLVNQLVPPVDEKNEPEQEKKENPDSEAKKQIELTGIWKGHIHTYKKDLSFRLEFQEDGDVHATIQGKQETLLNNVHRSGEILDANMIGDLGLDQPCRHPESLSLKLIVRDNVMNGSITNFSETEDRGGNGLSAWVELKKGDKELLDFNM